MYNVLLNVLALVGLVSIIGFIGLVFIFYLIMKDEMYDPSSEPELDNAAD